MTPSRLWTAVAALVCTTVLLGACDKIPLFAPTSSSITLTSAQRILPLNGSTEVTAVVLESSGTPVQNGTTVRFTTSMGRVDPVEVQTTNSIAITTFFAGNTSGVAEVRATSGGAGGGTGNTPTNLITFTIGAAAVDGIGVRATPSSVPATGGSVTVVATVLSTSGTAVSGVPVSFSTTVGTLSSSTALTDASGQAAVTLTASAAATVTASVSTGSGTPKTGTVSVGVLGIPAVTFTCAGASTASTNCSQTAGQAVTFNVAQGSGSSAITSATIDFGDNTTATLGALSSATTLTHIYATPNNYFATATATDANGQVTRASVVVTVGPAASPALTCAGIGAAAASCSQQAGLNVTFTATRATGSNLSSATLEFGDGSSTSLGTLSSPATVLHAYSSTGNYSATLRATEISGVSTSSSVAVSIVPRTPITVSLTASPSSPSLATNGGNVAFTATTGGDTTAQYSSFSWTFGDGATAVTSGTSTSHIYTATGNYTVTVTSNAVDGRSATGRTEVQIRP